VESTASVAARRLAVVVQSRPLAVLNLRDLLLFCYLDVDIAATAVRVLEVCIFTQCYYTVHEPMGVGAAVVHADWLALNSMWVAPTYPW
jgi:hypothetical protein